MVHYPHNFHAEAVAGPGIEGCWQTRASEHQTECAIPPVYEGSGEAFSPEEFFLLSLQNCFVATFKVYAYHLKLEYEHINVSADLIVDIEESHGPMMKSVEMNIDIHGARDQEKTRDLIERSLKDGLIFNSIRTAINPVINFS